MTDERYPIGKFQPKETYSDQEIRDLISQIEKLPAQIEQATSGLTAEQLNTPYRDGGWTLRQVIHHLADSHMNSYVRFKWTLTEDTPLIKAYDEKGWAETRDNLDDHQISLNLLKALHTKWVSLLKTLDKNELQREFTHPQTKKNQPLSRVIALYAWHGAHHLAHITSLKAKKGW